MLNVDPEPLAVIRLMSGAVLSRISDPEPLAVTKLVSSAGLSSISVRRLNLKARDMRQINSINESPGLSTLELDNHADTCVVGRDALVTHDYMRPVAVQAYDPSLGTQTYRTVSAVLGYHDPNDGRSHLLRIHQAIEIPHLDHHLLCPFQCRMHGIKIDDTAKFLTPAPTPSSHAMTLTDPDDDSRELHFPF